MSSSSLLQVLGGTLHRKRSNLSDRFNRVCTCPTSVASEEDALHGLAEYRYSVISQPGTARAFELYSGQGDQPIRGALHEINLENDGAGPQVKTETHQTQQTPYIALSYVWGNSRKSHLIECDGAYIGITCNLHSALLRLREVDEHVLVFADAICIDQGIEPEALKQRAVQVGMMDRIFGGAGEVIVDLGRERDNSSGVVELLARSASVEADEWEANMHNYQKALDAGVPGVSNPLWGDFGKFCERPWFERMWVIQEMALPAEVIVMVGRDRFSLETLIQGVRRCNLFRCLGPINNTQMLSSGESAGTEVTDHMTQANWLLGQMEDLRQGCQDEEAAPRSIGELLRLTCDFKATDLHDKVYSILGMAKPDVRDAFVIDYQESIHDLSCRLTTFLIDHDELTQTLNYHAALDAGEQASWMVDLTILERVERKDREGNWKWLNDNGYAEALSDSFNACGELKECRHLRPADPNLLIVSGAFLGEIKDISESMPQNRPRHRYVSDLLDSWTDIWKAWKWDRRAYKMVCRHLSHISEAERVQLYRRNLVVDGKYLTSGLFGWPDISEDLPAYISSVEEVMSYLSFEKLKDLNQNLLHPEFDTTSPLNRAMKYMINVGINCSRRRVCVTERGGLGLVPKDARVGDRFAILTGCPLPFVLRKKGDNWRLVGTAYLQGFMDGEALNLPEWELEGIVLC